MKNKNQLSGSGKQVSSIMIGVSCVLCLVSCCLFTACDYVANPLLPQTSANGNNNILWPDSLGYQNVLIEDYTGCGCINCPMMATRSEELIAQYGNRIVFMENNFGFDANPSQNGSGSPYNTWDAETAVGDIYGNTFVGGGSFPNAMVNRRYYNSGGNNIPDSSTLGETVDSLIIQNPTIGAQGMYIQILNSFNAVTSVLTTTVNTFFIKADTGIYNLVVLLTQDSISGPQMDRPTPFTSGYQHRFALRDKLTGSPWGDNIAHNPTVKQIVSKVYSYKIPANYQSPDSNKPPIQSNYKQSYVVAFVEYGSNAGIHSQYQVMQSQQKRVTAP